MNRQQSPGRDAFHGTLIALALSVWVTGQLFYHGAMRDGYVSPWLIAAVAGFITAAGFWLQRPWARWLGLGLIAGLAAATAGDLLLTRLVWWRLILLAGLGGAAWRLWRTRLSGASQDPPIMSLVLLFREPVHLEPAALAELASRAWNAEVDVATEEDGDEQIASRDARSLLVGRSPHFVCSHWPGLFAIHNIAQPYFNRMESVVESVREVRVQQALQRHRAWISVDVLHWFGSAEGKDPREAYRLIGRLLAELADENCLAVVEPVDGRVFAYDPETEAKLRSENPLEALCDWYYPPVLTVEADDPDMQAAVEEARRRWPEFVTAFEARHEEPAVDEPPFLVKAPFTNGEHLEYMWVRVTGIENDIIYGILENTPANVSSVQEGSRVRVRRENLSDWMCVINGQPAGALTLKVLAQKSKADPPEEDA